MSKKAVTDVNFLNWIYEVDISLNLYFFIVSSYLAEPMWLHKQVKLVDKFQPFIEQSIDIPYDDEEILLWNYRLDKSLREFIRRVYDSEKPAGGGNDPNDLRILWYSAANSPNVIILTCDNAILRAAEKLKIERRCMKAAVADAEVKFNAGVFGSSNFNTMFMQVGENPFVHYGKNKRCPGCYPPNGCDVSGYVPKND